MIRLLKGYARKSVLLKEFYDSIDSEQKVIVNCTDDSVLNVFVNSNICFLRNESIESVLIELRKHWFKHVFIYTQMNEDEVQWLIKALQDFASDFQTIMLTVQMDESYRDRFEIVELR